jgi:hypothetical protein
MKDWFSKCGANCSRCPAYKGNIQTEADRQVCSNGWHKYLGVRLNPERCCCDGCQTPDDRNPLLVYGKYGCNIRKCAVLNGAETCAHCTAYPCEAVQNQFSFDAGSRERIAARLGAPIPEDEYLTFIEPYELHRHLDELRASLGPEQIVDMTPISIRPRIVGFPDDLPLSIEETLALETLHGVLAVAGTADGIPHARQAALRERRRNLVKLLWTFGRYGTRQEDGGTHLVLDGATYLSQKIDSSYARLTEYFQILREVGVCCEHVPLAEDGWFTPGGALRKEGWFLKLSFDDEAGGEATLEALRTYALVLDRAYGKQAFRRFSAADMRVLS